MKFYRNRILLLIAAFIILLPGCRSYTVDIEKEKAAILALNEKVGQAHFEHDAVKFLSPNAREWYSVRDGTVSRRNKDLYREGLDQYLKSMDFKEIASLTPPEVKISEDGTMAWLIGNVQVKGIQTREDGSKTDVNFISAWLAVYEKQNGEWKLTANANTEKPGN